MCWLIFLFIAGNGDEETREGQEERIFRPAVCVCVCTSIARNINKF